MGMEGANRFRTPKEAKAEPAIAEERSKIAKEVRAVRAKRDPLRKEQESFSHKAKALIRKKGKRDREIEYERGEINDNSKRLLEGGQYKLRRMEQEYEWSEFKDKVQEPIEKLKKFYSVHPFSPEGRAQGEPPVTLDMGELSRALKDKRFHRVLLNDLGDLYFNLRRNYLPREPFLQKLRGTLYEHLDDFALDEKSNSTKQADGELRNLYLQMISTLGYKFETRTPEEDASLLKTAERLIDKEDIDGLRRKLARGDALVHLIFESNGNEALKELFLKTIDDIFDNERVGYIDSLFEHNNFCDPIREYAEKKEEEVLMKVAGVSIADLRGRERMGVSFQEWYMGRLITSYKELEAKMPGSVRKLMEGYGVKQTYRYPEEALLLQLKEEAIDQPYGIVMYPRADHNGAFAQKESQLESIFEQTQGKDALKIFEAESPLQVAGHLIRLSNRYPNHKIAFAVLGGHGTADSIQLSRQEVKQNMFKEKNRRSNAFFQNEFFEEDATIILNSCSTGKEGGIAQEMSRRLNLKVIGPDIATAFNKIEVSYDAGTPQFKVRYADGSHTMTYQNGDKVESDTLLNQLNVSLCNF